MKNRNGEQNQIRCAFFFHDTDYYSGGTRSLLDIIDTYMQDKNVQVIAVVPSDKGSAVEYLKLHNIKIIYSHYYQIRYDLDESRSKFLFKLIERMFRLVISKMWVMLKTVPKLKENNINVIYSNTSFILAGYWCSKSLNIPIVSHFREFGEEDHRIGIWFGRKKFYDIVNQYDKIICISDALKNKYQRFIDEEKISVIYDDVSEKYLNWNDKKFSLNENFDRKFNILIAGNLIPGKGQLKVLHQIVKLLKKYNQIMVYLAGNPSDEKYVKEIIDFIEESEISEQVKLLGLVENMNELRKEMHMGIVFSDMEAFGRVTIEGLLSGMLMVASDVGGSVELIEDGVNGFLAKKDGSNLEDIVNNIYVNYEKLEDVRKNGYKFAQKFTQGNCAKQLLKEIATLVRD